MKAAEAAYQKDLMNNIEIGGHPYSTYNTGKDVQKAVKALDPNRTASTATYSTAIQSNTSTDANSQDYTNYYNQYYSDPNYYYYYQQYYAQYGYIPQQEPKTAAELKEEEKNKQRDYIEQQMRKYRQPDDAAPKQEQTPQQYTSIAAPQDSQQQYAQEAAPPQKKEDEGTAGEWQEVSAEDMYSSYYRPVSPDHDDNAEQLASKKRVRSDSESYESDDDSDNQGKSFALQGEDSTEHDAGAEIVWKKRSNNEDNRPKKKIRRTII